MKQRNWKKYIDREHWKFYAYRLRHFSTTLHLIWLPYREKYEKRKILEILKKKGELSLSELKKFHWGSVLRLLSEISDDEYRSLCSRIFKTSVEEIRTKDTIKVCFIQYVDTSWSGDDIYRLFESDKRFEVCVLVTRMRNNYKPVSELIQYFRKRRIKAYEYNQKYQTDICIYATPYDLEQKGADIRERHLNELCVLIPYAFLIGKGEEHHIESRKFIRSQCIWRYYCYTKIHEDEGRQYNVLGRLNMVYSGYPKLDIFSYIKNDDRMWNFYPDAKKRVIYAPTMVCEYSTFADSWQLLYRAARHYQDIAWIFRPHPYLGQSLAAKRLINHKEFEAYVKMWKMLPNADVQTGGDYYHTIWSSDAMIADGTSLVSNYQYTGKPLLVLCEDDTNLSEYGRKLFACQYQSGGTDYETICGFLEQIVVKGMDPKREERMRFFSDNLDYIKKNGRTASRFIVEDICGLLERV